MFYFGISLAIASLELEQRTIARMRNTLTPESFDKWMKDRTAERRHRELCRSIEQAGKNAKPSGIGIFW